MNTLSLGMNNYRYKKPRGIKQFWTVYNILKKVLPNKITKSEILKNTHELIKTLKKKKYIDPNYENYEPKPDYLSSDVVDFFENHQEKFFHSEYSRMQDDFDEDNQNKSLYQFNKLNNLSN